ncbi:cytidylate kinase-like family protein [Oribacterium sp. WCC10]|uniref:cytidylate kinase-like family protein n=1 Tax=Oribacterium sp. WCC10 TaxID=1855343 RepID=UPI0008E08FB7|nr:cytidylate kinase-like family protein [Oribacterium sp. WCC10]SFG16245.1 Cytidylate kinase [Oribacterium sp. WCC10]
MDYKVITISRNYGSHGHELAQKLSERLGLPYYDRDFVKKTAAESGISQELIDADGEKLNMGTRFLEMLSPASLNSNHDEIFKAQARVVLELSQAPCIIVGRCSNYILREAGIPSFDIYLTADKEWRIENALNHKTKKEQVTDQYIIKKDKERSDYYKTYTGRVMGMADDYSICLDVGKIGMDKCVDIICNILK